MQFHVPTVLGFFGAWASVVTPLGGLSLWLADRQQHSTLAAERRLQERIEQVEGQIRRVEGQVGQVEGQVGQVEGRLRAELRVVQDSVTSLSVRLSGVAEDVAFIKGHLRLTRAPDASAATKDDR